jgi:hypothetical protein
MSFMALVPVCLAAECPTSAHLYCCALLDGPDAPVILDIADELKVPHSDLTGPGKVGAICMDPQGDVCRKIDGLVPVCCKGKSYENDALITDCAHPIRI